MPFRLAIAVALVLAVAPTANADPRICQVQIRFNFSPPLDETIQSGDVTTTYSRLCFYPGHPATVVLPGGDPDIVASSSGWDYVGNCLAATLDVNGSSTALAGVMVGGTVALSTQPHVYVLVPKDPCQGSPFATGIGFAVDNGG